MKLNTERLTLRELLPGDLNSIHDLHSLPETDRYNTMGIPKSIEQTQQVISGWVTTQNEIPRKRFTFVIEDKQHNFVGLLGMIMGKPGYNSAEIWYKLHLAYWGQGYAAEAVKQILYFGFTELKLHRIEAGCAADNIASARVLLKAGMRLEGLTRKKLPIRGEWHDGHDYAILEEDYRF